jgi:predicted transcriptional regulator of viral defense system
VNGPKDQQILAIIRKHPGVTIPELAAELGCMQNRLYRSLPRLAKDGRIYKLGRGWHLEVSR